jgi:hypothetical protein
LRFYREFTASVPDELSVFAALVHAPDGSGTPLAALILCHCGDVKQAEKDVRPLLEFGSPVMTQVGPMPYPAVNTMLDDAFPRGALNYWKSNFIRELGEDAIGLMVDRFARSPSPMSGMVVEHFHGAVSRVGLTDTAVPHREPGYNVLLASVWMDPKTTDQNIAWTRATFADLTPHWAKLRYVNYLGDDEAKDAVQSAYGPNYARLVEVKRKYDPHNLFRLNQNIVP